MLSDDLMMKRKRKGKTRFTAPVCLWDIVIEMTKWSMVRGAILGAVYGFLIYLLAIGELFGTSRSMAWVGAFMLGLPFGAVFGGIAGVILGLFDGLLIALFTWILVYPPQNWNTYLLSISIGSAAFTFVAGVTVFKAIGISQLDFLHLAVIPSLIAAITLGYGSQNIGSRYLEEINTYDSVETVTWFRW